ncbi:peptidoglycan -binding protein [Roseovarius sp. EL26]|uniref:peptidoglycan -binding protein n=1 Tax=Roseovarius sp. EL26 TaxID=2126672 RepID=UPI000EA1E146|nr:peptidoglycan -binding protein [Roseovarius sp. EL26]
MALSRRTGQRFQAAIWPGFVDAMTGLLLVLMFVLTIFMVVQFVLRETISGQEDQLDELSGEVSALAQALGLERDRSKSLEERVGALTATLSDARDKQQQQENLIGAQQRALESAENRIASFEEQVAGLLAQRDSAQNRIADLEGERAALVSEQEALNLALADLRDEVDANAEVARLAAAKREALEALIADLERDKSETDSKLSDSLAEAAAAEALRDKLKNADAELTVMTLALEEQRKQAEETLLLLAAAEAAKEEAETLRNSDQDQQAALLEITKKRLSEQEEMAIEAQKQQILLNQQVAALRQQLSSMQALLDDANVKAATSDIQLQSLGRDLNSALAQVAAEERRRRELEEAERIRLEAEKQDLEKYRSEFFGRLREVLGTQEGVRVVGDRFVFSSEVLFAPGQAQLSSAGQAELAKVAGILARVVSDIPAEIDWVLQVDGHTDDIPLSSRGKISDNWELSQARALSVVRYMIGAFGFPPERLSANGFGEFQPVDPADTAGARAQNRRIELKFTGK